MSNSKSNGNMSTLRLQLIDKYSYDILELIVTNGNIKSYQIHNAIKKLTTTPIRMRINLLLKKGLITKYYDTGEIWYKALPNGITFYNLLKQALVLLEIDYIYDTPISRPIFEFSKPKFVVTTT